jgi:hypothetical protein
MSREKGPAVILSFAPGAVTISCGVENSGPDADAGGLYTKLVWMTDYPACSVPSGCSSGPGEGTDACTAEMGWWGQPFGDPVCNPIDPPLPGFKRFFDDIIVMKR